MVYTSKVDKLLFNDSLLIKEHVFKKFNQVCMMSTLIVDFETFSTVQECNSFMKIKVFYKKHWEKKI